MLMITCYTNKGLLKRYLRRVRNSTTFYNPFVEFDGQDLRQLNVEQEFEWNAILFWLNCFLDIFLKFELSFYILVQNLKFQIRRLA